jgi:hypothetical protein
MTRPTFVDHDLRPGKYGRKRADRPAMVHVDMRWNDVSDALHCKAVNGLADCRDHGRGTRFDDGTIPVTDEENRECERRSRRPGFDAVDVLSDFDDLQGGINNETAL